MRKSTIGRLLALLFALGLIAAACGGDDDADDTGTDAGESADEEAADSGDEEADSGDEEAAADSGEAVTLRVLVHQNPPMVEFFENFNAEFEAANPGVSIDMTVVNAGDLGVSNQTRLTAQDLDVTTISESGFSGPVQDYMEGVEKPSWQTLIEAGLLMDLTDEAFVANYDETALAEGSSFDGRVYGVPLGRVTYSGMFVNEDLLAEVGVDVPTTWTELVAACEAVKGSGNECMTAGGGDTWPIFVGSYGLLGATYPDQAALTEGLWTGTIAWNDDTSTEMIEKMQTYATEMLEPGVTGLAHDAAIARYAAGDVAFAPTGMWQAAALEDAGPEFAWTYVPFPGSDNAADNQFLFGKYDQTLAIAAETPHPEEAVAYVAALSEPETYNTFINAVSFLPTQTGASLGGTIGEDLDPLVADFRVGFEQYWRTPAGAGQWANGGLNAASWFAPFGEFDDATELANTAQADLEAGLSS
jgi:raffinose/stachyose/melibiose transport system substrate-binding protein